MPGSESINVQQENLKIYSDRFFRLVKLGILDLILECGEQTRIDHHILEVNKRFCGEPNVVITASLSKSGNIGGREIFYKEEIGLRFDGDDLVVEGTNLVFIGKIPADETTRNKVIGEAIRKAFATPRRITKIGSETT